MQVVTNAKYALKKDKYVMMKDKCVVKEEKCDVTGNKLEIIRDKSITIDDRSVAIKKRFRVHRVLKPPSPNPLNRAKQQPLLKNNKWGFATPPFGNWKREAGRGFSVHHL